MKLTKTGILHRITIVYRRRKNQLQVENVTVLCHTDIYTLKVNKSSRYRGKIQNRLRFSEKTYCQVNY